VGCCGPLAYCLVVDDSLVSYPLVVGIVGNHVAEVGSVAAGVDMGGLDVVVDVDKPVDSVAVVAYPLVVLVVACPLGIVVDKRPGVVASLGVEAVVATCHCPLDVEHRTLVVQVELKQMRPKWSPLQIFVERQHIALGLLAVVAVVLDIVVVAFVVEQVQVLVSLQRVLLRLFAVSHRRIQANLVRWKLELQQELALALALEQKLQQAQALALEQVQSYRMRFELDRLPVESMVKALQVLRNQRQLVPTSLDCFGVAWPNHRYHFLRPFSSTISFRTCYE